MSQHSRKPKKSFVVRTAKRPKSQAWHPGHVQWSFALFDNHQWADESREQREIPFREIASHLKAYEQRSWNEIVQSKKHDHAVEVRQLSPEAQKRLREIKQDDIDELFRFRFTSLQRLWALALAMSFASSGGTRNIVFARHRSANPHS